MSEQQRICPACSTQATSNVAFCATCGTALSVAPVAVPSPSAEEIAAGNAAVGMIEPTESGLPLLPPPPPPALPVSAPVAAAPSTRSKPALWVGVGILVAVVLLAAGLLIGRGSSQNNAAIAPRTEPSTTIAASTPRTEAAASTTIAAADKLASAIQKWAALASNLPSGSTQSGVGQVGDSLLGVSVSSDFNLVVWTFNGTSWSRSDSIAPSFPDDDGVPNDLRLIDLTGDRNDEIFVSGASVHSSGEVFQLQGTSWVSVALDEGLAVSGNKLAGYTNPCIASCSAGIAIPYTYSWNGTGFAQQLTDNSGNPFELYETRTCSGPFRLRDVPPLQLCDKGPLVRNLQEALDSAGLLDGGLDGIDGDFGPNTAVAVRLYQFSIGEPVTGIADGQWYYNLIENYNGGGD